MQFPKIALVIVLLVLSQSLSTENKKFAFINSLFQSIKTFQSQTTKILSSMGQSTSAIFVVGDTGSGKSTFINFMSGSPLKIVKQKLKNRCMLVNDEPNPQLPIGHQMKSMTKMPTAYKDNQGRVWIDTPGFGDTTGFEADILNFLLMNHLFNKIQKKKIVLVISEDNLLSDRSQSLKQNLLRLKKWVGKWKGLAIVISKATDACEYKQYMQYIIQQDESLTADENRNFLLRTLASSKVIPFYSPKYVCSKRSDATKYVDQDRRKQMIQSLQQLDYLKTKDAKNIFIGDSALAINDLTNQIEQYISDQFEEIQQEIKEIAKNFAIQDFQILLNLIDNYIRAEGSKARQWRKRSFGATEEEIQKQINKISNLDSNKQFKIVVNTLTKVIDKRLLVTRQNPITSKLAQIVEFSSKFSKVFENTYLSREDGGDQKLVWIQINLEAQKFCMNLQSTLLELLGQLSKNEQMKKQALSIRQRSSQKTKYLQQLKKRDFWKRGYRLVRESYNLIYQELVEEVIPAIISAAEYVGEKVNKKYKQIKQSQFVKATVEQLEMYAYMLKISKLGRWVESFFTDSKSEL